MKFLLFSIELGEWHLQILEVNQTQSLGNLKLLLPEEEEGILEVKEVDKMISVDQIIAIIQM